MSSASRSGFEQGAARAGGERARRRGTPLLGAPAKPVEPAAGRTAGPAHRPAPEVRSSAGPKARSQAGEKKPRNPRPQRRDPRRTREGDEAAARRLKVVRDPAAAARPAGAAAGKPSAPPPDPTIHPTPGGGWTPDIEDLLATVLTVAQQIIAGSGLTVSGIQDQLETFLAYAQRLFTGDYEVDEFGFDADYAENVLFPLVRPLARSWFRIEARGIENIPREGPALIVSNHSGTIALDAVMTQLVIHDEHPEHRVLRSLGADLVFSTPFLGPLARRGGATLATNADTARLFAAGQIVGVWPEGFKGVGKPFSERYKLQRFGRGGFVHAALSAGVPIIPTSIVGAEEIAPMLGNAKLVARLLGLPYAPITPTFPWLGPLGLIPLPSKWIIDFGEPIPTNGYEPGAADDPALVFDLTDQVREAIQQRLYDLLAQRRSVFF